MKKYNLKTGIFENYIDVREVCKKLKERNISFIVQNGEVIIRDDDEVNSLEALK